jgi:2'-5' RNA ligase
VTSPPRSLRLFVAIELPDEQKQALAGLQDSMRSAITRRFRDVRVRWTQRESMHLTLKFLGATPPDRLESVHNALASAVPDPPAFNLSLAYGGTFADRIEAELKIAGWPREKRPFRAHITLARLPQDLSNETRRAIAETAAGAKLNSRHSWSIDHVSLIQSHLGREGARYEHIARYPA